MDFNPKVSIVIPVYNGSNYLQEAIDSALAQTYDNVEVIVVNDGSKDDGKTEAIAKSYGESIRYYYKENGGVASALNLAISKAEGDYISWLSHDDVYIPDKLEVQINYLRKEKNKESVLFYSDFEYINEKSEFLETYRARRVSPDDFIYSLFSGGVLHGCTLLIPKICFEKAGLFNESLRTTQDYELWFRFIKLKYVFKHVPKILVKSRIHPEQGTVALVDLCNREKDDLLQWALDYFSENKELLSYKKVGIVLFLAKIKNISSYAFRLELKNKNIRSLSSYWAVPPR